MRIHAFATIAMMLLHTGAQADEPVPSDEVVAKRLFEEGRVLYQQAKHIEACVLFKESYELDPAVGTKLNLAECAERQNKPRAAWLLWVAAAEEFEQRSDGRATFARKRADALGAKLATVIVRVARPRKKGLTITINDREISPSAYIVERTEAQRITVSASAPNRVPFTEIVSVPIGEVAEIEIPRLQRIGGLAPNDDPDDVEPSTVPWFGLTAVSASVTLGGLAVMFVAGRKVGDLEELDRQDPLPDPMERDRRNDEGERLERMGYVGVAVTMVGLVATTVFVVKGVRTRLAKRRVQAAVVPVLAPSYAGLRLNW